MKPALGYYLGLPAWAFPGWAGAYFPTGGSSLAHYASVFNTVEGNTTFYRVPDAASVTRWQQAVAGTDFRFSFKLPRSVTHERRPNWQDLAQFFAVTDVLGEHLGPFLVQCPATLGPDQLPALTDLFARLPTSYRYVLEVRHPDFFKQPALLEPLLEETGAGRVMFDSRPIYREDSQHPEVLAARHKKPDVPLLDKVYNNLVYARVVLHPEPVLNASYVAEWLARCQAYLAKGCTVYFMMHCPNNQHCPGFAKDFHHQLALEAGLPSLPPWPLPQQDSLF
ncbi:MAG: DUF72 domain-containing protein [Pseudomonadota bacterium]